MGTMLLFILIQVPLIPNNYKKLKMHSKKLLFDPYQNGHHNNPEHHTSSTETLTWNIKWQMICSESLVNAFCQCFSRYPFHPHCLPAAATPETLLSNGVILVSEQCRVASQPHPYCPERGNC